MEWQIFPEEIMEWEISQEGIMEWVIFPEEVMECEDNICKEYSVGKNSSLWSLNNKFIHLGVNYWIIYIFYSWLS